MNDDNVTSVYLSKKTNKQNESVISGGKEKPLPCYMVKRRKPQTQRNSTRRTGSPSYIKSSSVSSFYCELRSLTSLMSLSPYRPEDPTGLSYTRTSTTFDKTMKTSLPIHTSIDCLSLYVISLLLSL